jgi:hypothetical protein
MMPDLSASRPDRTPPFMNGRLLVALIVAVPLLVKLFCSPHYFGSDDSYIHLQVARNLIASRLWGINPGVRCNLSTAPLFTLLLTSTLYIFHSFTMVAMQVAACIATTAGLVAIFLRIESTTKGNYIASFFGLGTAAFACNLWRWNGTVMETAFAFCAVSWLLLLFRDFDLARPRAVVGGILLGFAVLLRPELFILVPLCCILILKFAPLKGRFASLIVVVLSAASPIAAWLLFSKIYFGVLLPTTYYAKTSGRFILWNAKILREYAELTAFSLLFPTLLLLLCLFLLRGKLRSIPRHLALPVLAGFGILTFYYFRAKGLEASGRYLLPGFPLFAVGTAELLAETMRQHPDVIPLRLGWARLVFGVLVSHLLLSLYLNARFISPVLQAFQTGYYISMCNASNFIAHSRPGGRALIYSDIGVISYCGNGRFFIADGKGLASPELLHRSFEEQIDLAKPAFVVESQGTSKFDLTQTLSGLEPSWFSAYPGHGISSPLQSFVNIYTLAPTGRVHVKLNQ